MKNIGKIIGAVLFFNILINFHTFADIRSGRYIQEKFKGGEDSPFMISLHIGTISSFDVSVKETKRASRTYDENREQYEKYLEDYTLDDLGISDGYALYGFQLEKRFKFLTLLFDFSYFSFEESSYAKDEPYAIGVKEISYQGNEYEYMLIPEGQSFDTEINGGIIQLDAVLTPFHVSFMESCHVTPWIFMGIYSIAGEFNIDAGEPQGITNYEYHPYDYVIGGEGEGWFGAGFPSYGIGGEFSLNFPTSDNDSINLVMQLKLIDVSWDGSTDDLGLNVRNAKDIELDYKNTEFRIYVELPVFKKKDILIGLKYQSMEANAITEAIERNESEIEAIKEKYDKNIDIEVETLSLIVSIRF